MMTLRTLAIVITGAGLFASLPLTDAQACDDDRYPCPVRSQSLTQETADAPAETAGAPARPTPSAQPRKKVNNSAPPNEKAQAKGEREAPRAAGHAKVSKPAAQERAADSASQKASEATPAAVPSTRVDQPLNDESRSENLVATAATPWPVLPNTEDAGGSAPGAMGVDTTEAAKTNAMQLVDPNEVNELDRAVATALAEPPWSRYLLLILGVALAAASAIWFFIKMASMFARRAANSRMRMSP
jgi:hypothetical protein